MEQSNEISRLGIQFGEDFQGEGKAYLKLSVNISKEAADSQTSTLNALTENKLDVPFCIVFGVSVSSAEHKKTLEE